MRRTLTGGDIAAEFNRPWRTARRVELQPAYWVAGERAAFEHWLAGKPDPAPEVEGTREWLQRSVQRRAAGIHVERVRVHRDEPTDYQRWLRAFSEQYVAAGDRIDYLTETRADQAGLLTVGARDWWLLDDERIILFTHDDQGRCTQTDLITDERELSRARAWWDLAVRTTRGEPT